MFKKLHVRIYCVAENDIGLQITEQSHRGDEFSNDARLSYTPGYKYISHEKKICLVSCEVPDWDGYNLFVRGDSIDEDDRVLSIPFRYVDKVLSIILEYNQYYNKNKLFLRDVVENIAIWERRDV